jgi:hypothetical protein
VDGIRKQNDNDTFSQQLWMIVSTYDKPGALPADSFVFEVAVSCKP